MSKPVRLFPLTLVMTHTIPEIDLSDYGIKEPKRSNLARNTKRQRKKIEEELGEKWSKTEEKVYNMIMEDMGNRHSLIRSSPQCMAVAEMVLARESMKDIVSFLRSDPYRFSETKISTSALRQQIIRFQKEVFEVLDECNEEGFNPIDFYGRLGGGRLRDPIAMMNRVLALQEHRLCIAIMEEDRAKHVLQFLDPTSEDYQKKYAEVTKDATRELELYMKILSCVSAYSFLQEPDQNVQRWMRTEVSKEFRAYMPFTVRRYKQPI